MATGAVPVPVSATVCGLFVALSVKVSVALRAPAVVGVNVTVTVHVPFTPSVAGEIGQGSLGVAKSPGLVPVIRILVMVSDDVPPFVRVTLCAVLVDPTACEPNVMLVVERPTDPNAPIPVKLTACGLPAVALSVKLTEALRLPDADGVNVTLIVQKLLAASVLGEMGQLLLTLKSPAFAPLTAIFVMVRLTFPVFVRVKVCAELVVFTVWLAKVTVEAERVATEAVPVPDKVAD